MRKAINLTVKLWIEGDDEPAHNFAQSTKQAVREIIASGLKAHPELQVTIKGITERGSGDNDSDDAHDARPS